MSTDRFTAVPFDQWSEASKLHLMRDVMSGEASPHAPDDLLPAPEPILPAHHHNGSICVVPNCPQLMLDEAGCETDGGDYDRNVIGPDSSAAATHDDDLPSLETFARDLHARADGLFRAARTIRQLFYGAAIVAGLVLGVWAGLCVAGVIR